MTDLEFKIYIEHIEKGKEYRISKWFYCFKYRGGFWFRLFGYGINIKNIRVNGLLFSQRNGKSGYVIGNYYIEFLKPYKWQ
jgi:hypothetical protein